MSPPMFHVVCASTHSAVLIHDFRIDAFTRPGEVCCFLTEIPGPFGDVLDQLLDVLLEEGDDVGSLEVIAL